MGTLSRRLAALTRATARTAPVLREVQRSLSRSPNGRWRWQNRRRGPGNNR